MTKQKGSVLGFHPAAYGFGWVLFESNQMLLDWGTFDAQGRANASCLQKLETILEKYRPKTLVIEAFDDARSKRHDRVKALCRDVIRDAKARKIETRVVSRDRIAAALGAPSYSSREQIAEIVAGLVDALQPELPRHRQVWEGERWGLAMFSAAACVLASQPK